MFRKLFGPSREEIWRQLSAEIKGKYIARGMFKGDRVEGTHGDWTVTLDIFAMPAGKTIILFTRLRAPYVNKDGFRFNVHRRGMFTELGKMLGMQDVQVGYEPFDHDFVIQGSDENRLRALFGNERIRALLQNQKDVRFSVKDDEGYFGAAFPEGVDELLFMTLGVIKDLDRLKAMYDLFGETLDHLCRIGSAYEKDPDVAL